MDEWAALDPGTDAQAAFERIRNDARRFLYTERQLCRAGRITEFHWNPGHRLMERGRART
jgi:hypothetical protein